MGNKPIDSVIFVANDNSLAEIIGSACEVLGVTCLSAKDVAQASTLFVTDHSDACFVLPAGEAHEDFVSCRRLILHLPNQGASCGNIARFPQADVFRAPWSVAELLYLLQRMTKRSSSESYATNLMALVSLLKQCQCRIDDLFQSSGFGLGLEASLLEFCVRRCPHGREAESVSAEEKSRFKRLSLGATGTPRYCDRIPDCQVRKFASLVAQSSENVLKQTLAEAFRSSPASLAAWEQLGEILSSRLLALKKSFCSEHCGRSQTGSDFRPGHVMISNWTDLLDAKIRYCAQDDCPLRKFFVLHVVKISDPKARSTT